ncbi:LapA family protein [Pedobacter nutrimenti]|nr:LapA family protein [Pedobacter nutrimenti]
MSNRDSVEFSFIFFKQDISKLLVVGIFTFIGFILGYWAGRPRTVISTYDNKFDDAVSTDRKNTLSDEDKDYIS